MRVAIAALNLIMVVARSLAVTFGVNARRGRQAFRIAGKAAIRATDIKRHAVMPWGTIGPACAALPAMLTIANAENAMAEAVANC